METTKDPLTTLDSLIEAGQAATPGEWKTNLVDETLVTSPSRDVAETLGDYDTDECEQMAADATFIALAKNALPSLIALRAAYADQAEELAKLRADNEALREAVKEHFDADVNYVRVACAFVGEVTDTEVEEANARLDSAGARLRALVEGKG